MNIKKEIQSRLKKRRSEMKLTQEDLAKKVNTTKASVSNYENGHSTPPNDMLIRIAKALQTSTDWLLGLTDDPSPNHPKKIINNDGLKQHLDHLLEISQKEGKVYLDESKTNYMEYEDILWLKTAFERSIKKEND